jgi:thioredoxin 1
MKYILSILVLTVLGLSACRGGGTKPASVAKAGNAKITFLELGSVTCIPCKKMQPVMKAIETRYTDQIKVVFYDVMKDRAPAQQYGIKLIPTQIFLDSLGKELMRHEGFFAEEEIDKFLKAQGLEPRS